jgi:Holliday junction DNA helicase RuvB
MIRLRAESVRPTTLDEIIGAERIKRTLGVYIRSARRRRGEAADRDAYPLPTLSHVLFTGPPGLGKTTFASVIATEMGADLIMDTGPNVDRQQMIVHISAMINATPYKPLVLFIDELHAISKEAMVMLLPLMEDYSFADIENINPFTLVGATTDPDRLTGPLRDRFRIKYDLDFYSNEEIAQIVARSLSHYYGITFAEVDKILSTPGGQAALASIARRCHGTPRLANDLVQTVRDFALDATPDGPPPFTTEMVQVAMEAAEIDSWGLDPIARRVITTMAIRYRGKPVGVRALASGLQIPYGQLENVIEPRLIRAGYVNREQRGRTLTPEGMLIAGLIEDGQIRW